MNHLNSHRLKLNANINKSHETSNCLSKGRPVIDLVGTPFYVGAQWLYLVEVGNPGNKIDIQETRAFNSYIELWYDPSIKNVYQGSVEQLPNE